ncbi:MAG: Gfo/Idh/MocA family oxidoreductase [Oscillospiraceae bacterium]|nr:Gfo/Idh/MocA family oxidoreductase [Oscillospiraceae bacterium]
MARKVRLGMIGIGAFANTHLKGALQCENAELVALADADETRLHQYDDKYHLGHLDHYTNYHDMLARDDIEGVIVVTNDQSHRQPTVDALMAGKHVLCEKPMALSMDDCRAMIEAEKKSGKKLMVGQIGRYTTSFNDAIRLIEDGEIGEIFFVESEYAHDYSQIPGSTGWRKTPERHAIIGGGCHAVDLLRRIAGNPTEISAFANHKVLTDWPVDDCTVAIMKFPNNVIGKVFCSIGCKRSYTMRTCVYGTKGTLIFNSSSIEMYKDHFTDSPLYDKLYGNKAQHTVKIPVPTGHNDHNTKGEIGDFCDSIINDTSFPCTGIEGAVTAYACMAIVESARTGEKVIMNYDFM